MGCRPERHQPRKERWRMKKIGFIGLGNMGLPMAANLVKAGFEVYGLNRSKGAEEKFAQAGGRIGLTRAQLAAEMDMVITCLPMPADVEEVYLSEDGLIPNGRPGLLLADCSTVGPELSRRLYEAAAARGIAFLDAPVSGGTVGAAEGTLSIMVGGDRGAFDRAMPAFEAMGNMIRHVGPSGSGSAVKLINQLMVGIHTQAVSEALALGRRAGIDEALLVDILMASFASSRILGRHYEGFIAKDSYEPGFAIRLLGKDLELAAEMAEQCGVRLKAGARVRGLLRRAIASGYGDRDMAAMFRFQTEEDAREREAGPIRHYAVFLPMKDAEKSERWRPEHLRFLDEQRAAGRLFANGRFTDGAGGLVIYRARSYEEVESWVKQDPYVVHGARGYEIHEWDVVPAEG
nr:NAD(P)-binding domain-containing protein [Thermobacillus sp. ZCTH02-B1]